MNKIVIYRDEPVPYWPDEIKKAYVQILKHNYKIEFQERKPGAISPRENTMNIRQQRVYILYYFFLIEGKKIADVKHLLGPNQDWLR